MNGNDAKRESEYDSYKEVVEFQNNALNPGHYVGTGRVPPTVSAPGNATPLAVACFLAFGLFLFLGLCLFFSDVNFTSSGLIESDLINRSITLVIFVGLSLLFLFFGFVYLKKAKKYFSEKNKHSDETTEEEIWQLTCPRCGHSHNVDYSRCPNCDYEYDL